RRQGRPGHAAAGPIGPLLSANFSPFRLSPTAAAAGAFDTLGRPGPPHRGLQLPHAAHAGGVPLAPEAAGVVAAWRAATLAKLAASGAEGRMGKPLWQARSARHGPARHC